MRYVCDPYRTVVTADVAVDRSWFLARSTAHTAAGVLYYAVEQGLFALTRQPRFASELATRLGVLECKLTPFLHALSGIGLLEIRGGCYQNTAVAARYLAPGAAEDLTAIIRRSARTWRELGELDRFLGGPEPAAGPGTAGPGRDEHAVAAHRARAAAGPLARLPEWARCATVAEMGWGHGLYASGLRAARAGIQAETWPSVPPEMPDPPLDALVLCDHIGSCGRAEAMALLAQAARPLRPGGLIAVVHPVSARDDTARGIEELTDALTWPGAWRPTLAEMAAIVGQHFNDVRTGRLSAALAVTLGTAPPGHRAPARPQPAHVGGALRL